MKNQTNTLTAENYIETMLEKASVCDSKLKNLLSQQDAELFLIREKYDKDLTTLQKEKDNLILDITQFGFENKGFFDGVKKTFQSRFGTCGFRTTKPKLNLLPDFDWQQVTENLKRYLPSYLRVHVEPAKDKLLADRFMPEVVDWLDEVGLQVTQEESFFVDLSKRK